MSGGGAEYVARMEDVLDLYAEAPDPRRPRVCVDEHPYQLVSEVRQPLPAAPGRPARYDYEYKQEGTCNLFVVFQPQKGWREVVVTARRTTRDFAHLLKRLVDETYPDADVIRLVTNNQNTHSNAALYETFQPAEARRIARKRQLAQHGRD